MDAHSLRQSFLDFFASKQHQIVPSAPMVVKDDPTLMFTNAGMNQFKDLFLGNAPIKYPRIADSQKCLRVSGKHNDLEEVGHDTYHHTMFEMLGNWSFGNYFKEEAITWAWEYLTDVLKINKNNLYVTVFEGDKNENIDFDSEAYNFWKKHISEDRILKGNKKDNFWEMGESGPCGPCSEIHVDIRNDSEKQLIDGKQLVNCSHPQVIEIWNLVFIQYNRKANGQLETLPASHVDTGMGFERLCMVVQGKQSNYDTDVFQPIILEIANLSGISYNSNEKSDIAMRVIADHLRTISFSIADGQLPSNNKAGYVIRRILRRAVRYGYTFLKFNEPFIYKLLPVLIKSMGAAYPELINQKKLIEKVIQEEESSFLKTLETGIKLLEKYIEKAKLEQTKIIKGEDTFLLYDTYGFPFDLTELILRENNLEVDKKSFDSELQKQKERARNAAVVKTDDWIEISKGETCMFIGYDSIEAKVSILKYRKVNVKKKDLFQLVFNVTPFYAESGGQVGDSGYLIQNGKKTNIIDTIKENNLFIHLTEALPDDVFGEFNAVVNKGNRNLTENNHTATHLLHFALQEVLGSHVEQKGSLVNPQNLRFDFSHYQKLSKEELEQVENRVNELIRQNIELNEMRSIPIQEARNIGAKALFGEKYGENVRVIKFDDSVELCGGTHANSTGNIGLFKIVSESAIAAGIRRIEAVTASTAESYVRDNEKMLDSIKELLKQPQDILKSVEALLNDHSQLQKKIEKFNKEKAKNLAKQLEDKIVKKNEINVITQKIDIDDISIMKEVASILKDKIDNLVLALAADIDEKANITILISQNLVKDKGLNACNLIKEISTEIKGGGGGQPFLATAGGKAPEGINQALIKIFDLI
ncbi:MAG: alanine--tRNA ligase [Bacteroidales bacterium]|nr:alanine--tRNA ligase [Bacteroidales bacterium]